MLNSKRSNALCRSCGQIKKISTQKLRFGDLSVLLDENYESYYWVGFLLADGYFSDNNRLTLTLARKDENHLNKFAKFIKFKGKVQIIDSVVYSNKAVRISVQDSAILPLLKDKFNILSRKTYNPPTTFLKFKQEYCYCLLAGFIDGDGCIKNLHKRKDFNLSIKVHKNWLGILKEFNVLISGTDKFTRINTAGYASLTISNTEKLKALKVKLLTYNIPLLERKWDIIDMNFTSRDITSLILRKRVLKDLRRGLSMKEIGIKNNTSYMNVYRIKTKYL